MRSELLARVRWNNVGAVALAAGLLVLVVAWPALSPEAPELPRETPRAVVHPEVPRAAETSAPAAPRRGAARPVGRPPRPRRPGGRREQRAREARTPAPVVAPRAVAPPAAAAYEPAPAAAPEFAFEK